MATPRLLRMRADPIATARSDGRRDRIGLALSLVVGTAVHAALWFGLARASVRSSPLAAAPVTEVIELEPPVVVPLPPPPPPRTPDPPPVRHRPRSPAPPAPAPSPGADPPAVLSRARDAPAPVDF